MGNECTKGKIDRPISLIDTKVIQKWFENVWLVTSIWAAIIATIVYLYAENPKKYHLDWLCLMLWGLAAMVMVDHSIGFIREGGEFIEVTTEGYIESGTLLGIVMLIPIFIIWEIAVLISRAKARS